MSQQDSDFALKMQGFANTDVYTIKDVINNLSDNIQGLNEKFVSLSGNVNIINTNFSHLSKKVDDVSESLKKIADGHLLVSSIDSKVKMMHEEIHDIKNSINTHAKLLAHLEDKDKKREHLKDVMMRSWIYPTIGALIVGAGWVIDLFYRMRIK